MKKTLLEQLHERVKNLEFIVSRIIIRQTGESIEQYIHRIDEESDKKQLTNSKKLDNI